MIFYRNRGIIIFVICRNYWSKMGENMINKVNTVEQLEFLIKTKKFYFCGNNWIGKLVKTYLFMVFNKKITINDTFDKELSGDIFIFEKEANLKKILNEVSFNSDIYMISDTLKDDLDSLMMKNYPDVYEGKVLYARKEEMDFKRNEKFRNRIEEFLKCDKIPLFESIEIETINRCNGTCSFCPINRNDDVRVPKKMREDLFYGIIDQLAELQYRGRIALFSNNEPFIDDRIVEFAKYTAEKLPNACKIIFTNGTLVKENTFNEIIQYIDIFNFDIYYDYSVEKEIPDQVKNIIKNCMDKDDIKKKVMIQTIDRSAIRNNRGGQSANRHNLYMVKSPCMLPFIQMIVRPTGKTSLCCNDAIGKYTLADLEKETIIEAWNNNNYKNIRQKLRYTRQSIEICKLCDNFASTNIIGNNCFTEKQFNDAWEKIEKILF